MKTSAPGEEVSQRLNFEGADPLLLAGVNEVNLAELERAIGARVSLRGDTLTLSGTAEQVERAAAVALYDASGRTAASVAAELGVPQKTLESWIRSARRAEVDPLGTMTEAQLVDV